ncbi:MAG TPA: nuclear transport factor 2 family protein [Opitutaceae bacterium]|nr:nuclear transport factor 2 family protein [Opitutaceae bacterium]
MQNLKSVLRNLARSPGFTGVAIATLALGIGLSASSFGTANVFPAGATEAAPATDKPEIVQAVLAANERLNDAASRLDTDAFFAGIVESDESRIIQDGQLFKTRAEAMAAVRAGSQGVAKVERRFESPHVAVLAPDAALLTAEGTTEVTLNDGRNFEVQFAVSLVFVLRDGEWKLLHGHYSLPNPQP